MITYNEYLNRRKYLDKLYEFAMSKQKKQEIQRFRESGDFKSILKEINILIEKIKNNIKNIKFDGIEYLKNKNEIEIYYNDELRVLLNTLKEQLSKDWNNDFIINNIFQDGYRDFFLEIELHGQFNQLHIMDGLPNFMKNLGIGKKIYKKLIKNLNYLSSFYGVEPSMDSNMTWDSILNDNEIYSFTNDDNIICFWYEFDYDKIIEKLKQFFKYDGDIKIDDDFLLQYELSEEQFLNIIRT